MSLNWAVLWRAYSAETGRAAFLMAQGAPKVQREQAGGSRQRRQRQAAHLSQTMRQSTQVVASMTCKTPSEVLMEPGTRTSARTLPLISRMGMLPAPAIVRSS